MKKWYAKSKRPGRKQVEVKEHLCAVGELSKEYGRQLGMEKKRKWPERFMMLASSQINSKMSWKETHPE